MRRLLDGLYTLCGALAALSMIALLIMVLVGIVDRYFSMPFKGTDAYSGYMMAAAGFLALAHTFRKGEHIRVTLFINALKGRARFALELWALAAGTVLAGLFAVYAVKFTWQSHTLKDISTSMDATPLWIPQITMAFGCVVFFIAMLDTLVTTLRNGSVQLGGDANAPAHNE